MLGISTKHALQALIFLSSDQSGEYMTVEKLAEETAVPQAFLSKIVKILARYEIVQTKKGVNGGVRFLKDKVSFYEVCEVMQDPILLEKCFLSTRNCKLKTPCQFHDLWSKERAKIHTFLREATIERQDSP